jgi:hypothetical protein
MARDLGGRTERRRKAESIAETVEQQQSHIEDDEAEIQRMQRLDELQRFTAKRPTSRLVDSVVNIFKNYPEVVPDVQSRTDIGAASRAEVDSAREELVKSRLAIEKAKTRINKLRQTVPAVPAIPPSNESARSQRERLFSFVSYPYEVTPWPTEAINQILTHLEQVREAGVTTQGHKWLEFIATRPTITDRSAREQAAHMFFSGRWSIADLHALVLVLSNATSSSLEVVIAFLFQLVQRYIDQYLDTQDVPSRDSYFAISRVFQLIAVHCVRAHLGIMSEVQTQWRVFKGLINMPGVCFDAMTRHIDDLLDNYGTDGIATHFTAVARDSMKSGELILIPDGNNLVMIDGKQVHLLRETQFFVQIEVGKGV